MSTDKTLADVQPGGRVRLGDQRSDLVPGIVRCAKCQFQLARSNLNMHDGTMTAGDSKTEPCPNGCGPLWPVTWETWAREGWAEAERLHLANAALSAQPSPGGQGDAVELLACFLNEPKYDLDMDHEISLRTAVGAIAFALAARQPVGNDGQPMVLVSQEFKGQAEHDAEITSAVGFLLRNNQIGLSGSQPEMVETLLSIAARQPVVQEPVARSIIEEFVQCADVGRPPGKLLAQARDYLAAPPAQAVDLAPDHRGMRVSCSGLLSQVRGGLKSNPELAEMVRQLHGHLNELGKRWYAGDRKVVDEFLQLYVIEDGARRALIDSQAVGK